MKKLLKQILSEVQDIREALEPEVTPEPVNYPGRNNDVCNQVHSSSADQLDADQLEAEQKPKLPESMKDIGIYPVWNMGVHEEALEAFMALENLYVLRKAYWQAEDWKPDWKDYSMIKHCIYFEHEELIINTLGIVQRFLAFPPNTGQAEHFLKHHRALIEQARELL